MYKRLFEIDKWKLFTYKMPQKDMRLSESIMSTSNGYMGVRGNFEESYSSDSHKGNYIAGVWFPDKTRVGWWKNGYPDYFGKVINAPDFLSFDIIADDIKIDLAKLDYKDFYFELDMKKALLTRKFIVLINKKQLNIEFQRFISASQKELALIKLKISCNEDISLSISTGINADIHNEDANYDESFWEIKEVKDSFIIVKTKENPFGTPRFAVCTAMEISTSHDIKWKSEKYEKKFEKKSVINLKKDDSFEMVKYISVTTSRDHKQENLAQKAYSILENAKKDGYELCKKTHEDIWQKRWDISDVEILGDDEAQQGIRFNLFQLFSTYYGEDERLNIGPKGFTGEKYGGATYWDTEAYLVDMYLGAADKSVVRNLLLYRYNQLPQAFENAKKQGLKGALYPMVTFNGIECHNEWEITFEEIHRNAAMVYAVYSYTNYTGDKEYLNDYGIFVITAIAKFWADRVHYSKHAGKYMIHGVTGPNEYENNINNNFYTNFMAAWCLKYTLETIEEKIESLIRNDFPNNGSESSQKIDFVKNVYNELNIDQDEILIWKDIAENMYIPFDDKLQIFVQHDTFLDKDLAAADSINPDERPINQYWSWDKILRSCFIKQADVLQAIYFFPEKFTYEEKKRHFEFYEPMTVHESSLSASVHAVLAARLNMHEKAMEMYKRTSRLDLDNYNNDTEDGLHITSMSGGWLSIVHGFAGMQITENEICFSPFVPKGWNGYSFKINYRGSLLLIELKKYGDLKQTNSSVSLLKGSPVKIKLYGESYLLKDRIVK